LLPWCQSIRVSVTARLERRSDPGGRCEQRETPSRFVRLVCCSPAPHGAFGGVAMSAPRGALRSRESLTQDSRSAVKARRYFSIRYANHSVRSVALRAKLTWTASRRGRHVGLSPPSRDETRVDAAPAPLRAYVTGGWLRQLRRAPAARACALRHHATSHGELMARDTSGASVVRGMHRTLAASSGWDSDEGRRRLRCVLQVPAA